MIDFSLLLSPTFIMICLSGVFTSIGQHNHDIASHLPIDYDTIFG